MGHVRENRVRKPGQRPKTKPLPVMAAASAAPPAPPRAYFLIGENKTVAAAVAEHEWGWKKTKTGWTGGPMACSGFLADLTAVKKEIDKGAPIAVYEGYKWYAAIPPHLLQDLVKAGSVVMIPAPTTV